MAHVYPMSYDHSFRYVINVCYRCRSDTENYRGWTKEAQVEERDARNSKVPTSTERASEAVINTSSAESAFCVEE